MTGMVGGILSLSSVEGIAIIMKKSTGIADKLLAHDWVRDQQLIVLLTWHII